MFSQYANPKTFRYIVIPTGTVETCSNRVSRFPTSLNDCGDMVGYTVDSGVPSCGRSPWIWSLCGRFGLDPETKYLLNGLTTPSGPTPSGPGKAWGINNDGDVVGEQVVPATGIEAPFIWRFSATGLASAFALEGPSNPMAGVARSVSESSGTSPAYVVGTRNTGTVSMPASTAFYHVLGDPPNVVGNLGPLTDNTSTAAYGVARATSGGAPVVGGSSATSPNGTGFAGNGPSPTGGAGVTPIGCGTDGSVNAVRWTASGSPAAPTAVREDFATSGPIDLSQWNARIYSVDGSNRAVGAYIDPDLTCRSRAAFWQTSGVAVALGLISPLTFETQSLARSIAPVASGGSTIVVGAEDAVFQTGVIWWRESGTSAFQATLATQIRLLDCSWQILSITDVNAKGWMSAEARDLDLDGDVFAVLLIPDPCPADITLDGQVGSADLAALLGAWGACPTGMCACLADLDFDGDVDQTDSSILLGAWGAPCSYDFCAGCTESVGVQQSASSTQAGIDLPLEYVLAASGQPSIEAFSEWVALLSDDQRASFAAMVAAWSGGGSDDGEGNQ